MGIFGNSEKKQILDFINKWEPHLAPAYKNFWLEHKKKIDAVAKEMRLKEKEILYITKREFDFCLISDYKKRINLTKETENVVINKKGTTKTLEFLSALSKDYKEYTEKCSKFVVEFDKKINSYNTPKR